MYETLNSSAMVHPGLLHTPPPPPETDYRANVRLKKSQREVKNTINSPPPPFSLIFLSIMTVIDNFLYGRFVCDVFGCYPFLFLCCKVQEARLKQNVSKYNFFISEYDEM